MRNRISETADKLMTDVGQQVCMEAVLDEFVTNTEDFPLLVYLVPSYDFT